MPRAALLLAIGIALGAVAAVYVEAPRSPVPNAEVPDAAPPSLSTPVPTLRARAEPDAKVIDSLSLRPRGTAERAAFYAAVARADARGIETLLIGARAISDRHARLFALDVLLARYAELDASEAVAAAKELDLPAESLVPLYQAWLKSSPSAALASLGALEDPKKVRVATGVLAFVSDDDALVAQLLAALPAQTANQVYLGSLAQLAQTSPAEALAHARKIADSTRRREAVNRVLFAWAQSDPRAVADYLEGLDAEEGRGAARTGVWTQIATAAPDLALERVATLPEDLRPNVQSTAIQALAQRDPKAAIARLADMPRGVINRDGMLPLVARAYAARDPEGALAWARALQPPVNGVMAAVVSGLADKDPARAFDLASEIASPTEQLQALQQVVNFAIARDPTSVGPLLERVLAMPNSAQRQTLVQMAVASLANSDPSKAAEWLIANPGQSSVVTTQVASAYARADPARAAAYSSRFTGDAHVAWVRGVAGTYAQVDSRAAIEWVEQLRGSPEYDEAAFAILQSATPQDPAIAVRLVDSISREDYRRNGTLSLAMHWTNTDPVSAANWAANLRDPTVRTAAIQFVGSTWAQQNAPAAKEWVLSQPPGPARDGALQSLLSVSARFGPPDVSLLANISTDQGRISAVQTAALMIAQRDSDGARAFVENNVADPQQRERVLAMVSQIAARRTSMPVNGFGGAMYPPGVLPPDVIGLPGGATAPRPFDAPRIVNGVGSSSTNVQRTAPPPTGAPATGPTERP
jgi:hypothetical protein